MKELLTRYGYTYEGSCHCDGFPTEKYKSGDYQVRIRNNKNLFKIKKGGRSITQWVPASQIETALNNIHNAVIHV
jgi:hypothetical protein